MQIKQTQAKSLRHLRADREWEGGCAAVAHEVVTSALGCTGPKCPQQDVHVQRLEAEAPQRRCLLLRLCTENKEGAQYTQAGRLVKELPKTT